MDASSLDRHCVDLRSILLALAKAQGDCRMQSRALLERADELERSAKLARGLLNSLEADRRLPTR